jgi:hypothetical protein
MRANVGLSAKAGSETAQASRASRKVLAEAADIVSPDGLVSY